MAFQCAAFAMAGAWPLIAICNVIVHLDGKLFRIRHGNLCGSCSPLGLALCGKQWHRCPLLAAISSQKRRSSGIGV